MFFPRLQIEQSEKGLDSLALSQKTIQELRGNFIAIEKYVFPILFIYFLCVCVANVGMLGISGIAENVKL